MEEEILPHASHEGTLPLGDKSLRCAVLDNGIRILSMTSVFKAFDRPARGNARVINMPVFLDAKNLQPFIGQDLIDMIIPIHFVDLNGNRAYGYNALILPKLCKVYLDARATINPKSKNSILTKPQLPLARASEVLLIGLAGKGIESLIDKATGYENEKALAKREYYEYLEKLVLTDKAAKWIPTFPDDFFEMIFRFNNWTWNTITKNKKPSVIGHFINNYVYSRIAPGLLTELRIKNPVDPKTGNRPKKHHSWLTPDFGHPKLKEHLKAIDTLYRLSGNDKGVFEKLLDRAYPKYGQNLQILFPDTLEIPDKEDDNVKKKLTKFDQQLIGLLRTPPPNKEK